MARNKETLVLLIDVGPTMHQHREYTSKAITALMYRKLVHSKFDEVGVVYFGADETENMLSHELPGYENIVVARRISVIAEDVIPAVNQLPQGSGVSDFVSTVVVGLQMIVDKVGEKSKGNKRICLFTDAETPVKDPEDGGTKEDQVTTISNQLQLAGVSMDVVVIQPRETGNSLMSKASQENEFLLKKFSSGTKGQLALPESYTSLFGSVRSRLVSPTTLFRGELELTPSMSVKVWVYKKVSQEKLPTLRMYSDKAAKNDVAATHEVKLDIEYKSSVDVDASIPPEQRIKAYKYGPQFVPISSKEEDALKFKTEKGLKLIGFTDASNIPRHYSMKEANVFVPEPGNSRSTLAVSCLVRALVETGKVALVRCVWRAGQTSVVLGVLTPHPASEDDVADCFYFNILPFAEDIREYPFVSFNDQPATQQPSQIQQDAADAFVQMMDLAPYSKEEILQPETTVNPVLQRFYSFLNLRSSDPDAYLPRMDNALMRIVEPDQSFLRASELALRNFRDQFTLTVNTQKEKGNKFWQDRLADGEEKVQPLEGEDLMQLEDGRPLSLDFLTDTKVNDVGNFNPVQDFEAMLARRDGDHVPKAIQGMKKIITDLLDSAYNGNTYEKSLACLVALRVGCVTHEEPVDFNSFLQDVASKCRGKRLNDFWELIVSKTLTLISKDESPDSEVTPDEAVSFLSGDAGKDKGVEAPEEEIDEMDALFDDII